MIDSIAADPAAQRALAQRDLTDPAAGPHALQQLIAEAHTALADRWHCRRELHRGSPILAAQSRPSVPGRHDGLRLRPNMRTLLPALLAAQALDPPEDLLLVCPGLVYRRSPLSPLHAAEPHQLDLWRLYRGRLGSIELADMVRTVLAATLPGRRYRLLPSARPHLTHGMRVDIHSEHGWVAIGRIGLLAPALLSASGLNPATVSGLGMTLGLDRVLMQRKGLTSIQLLRSRIPAIASQMLDLCSYTPPADTPAQHRELFIPAGACKSDIELAERIRALLPERLDVIEQAALQPDGRLRLVLRHHGRVLTAREADGICDEIGALFAQPVAAARPAYA